MKNPPCQHVSKSASVPSRPCRAAAVWLFAAQSFLTLAILCFHPAALRAATIEVSPNVISNDYPGVVTLQIGGLNSGETVMVERFTDFNNNNAVDPGEFALQAFPLKDGEAVVFGGITNLHVPGDMDAIAGSITANLYMQVLGFDQKAIGKHVYRVSSPTSRFTPVSASFTITNSSCSAQVSGSVKCDGTNIPNALVVIFDATRSDVEPVSTASADSSGNYSIKVRPGAYMLAAFNSNCVASFAAAPIVQLSPGASATTNITLLAGSRRISGRISDENDSFHGLGGLLTVAESPMGQVSIGFTDRNGIFSIAATPGVWRVGPDDFGLHFLGYPGQDDRSAVDVTSGDATGVSIAIPEGNALLYGTALTDTLDTLEGLVLYGYMQSQNLSLTPVTDQLGRFFAPVIAGSWEFGVTPSDNPSYGNYVFSEPFHDLPVQLGAALAKNIIGKQAPYLISGYLKNTSQTPVSGVNITVTCNSDGVSFMNWAVTDPSGFFSMPAFNGVWSVGAACEGDQGLQPLGYRCMSPVQTTVANANAAVLLTAQPCGTLQIVTASLPNGRVGEYYSQYLAADSCSGNFNWSLASGSGPMPPGLALYNNGQVQGTPTQSGQWTFKAQVSDGTSIVSKDVALQVENSGVPLYVMNGNLPDGTNGIPYNVHLEAAGGQPPYTWSLAPGSGSLPGGMMLLNDGAVTGVPNQNGQFYFNARVTDSSHATSDKLLALYIANATPVQPVLASPTIGADGKFQFVVNGKQGTVYALQGSVDLKTWNTLRSTNAPGDSFVFIVDAPANPVTFYRLAAGAL